jgi:hypothetical protein
VSHEDIEPESVPGIDTQLVSSRIAATADLLTASGIPIVSTPVAARYAGADLTRPSTTSSPIKPS